MKNLIHILSIIYFNPRSREGSDIIFTGFPSSSMYFNPRSREGSDSFGHFLYLLLQYFNPRSREGSDLETLIADLRTYVFQSTLPRRERHQLFETSEFFNGISIHAPAKGATAQAFRPIQVLTSFQSTLPRRERLDIVKPLLMFHVFQSTLPRRERHTFN